MCEVPAFMVVYTTQYGQQNDTNKRCSLPDRPLHIVSLLDMIGTLMFAVFDTP
jgi:hypothetical protein